MKLIRPQLAVGVTPAQLKWLKAQSELKGIPVSAIVRLCIANSIETSSSRER